MLLHIPQYLFVSLMHSHKIIQEASVGGWFSRNCLQEFVEASFQDVYGDPYNAASILVGR